MFIYINPELTEVACVCVLAGAWVAIRLSI